MKKRKNITHKTTRIKKIINTTIKPITRYNTTKVGFLNINGITTHSLLEAKNTMSSQKLTLALLVETKIRLEDEFNDLNIEGYTHFQIRRSDAQEDKNGGGMIAYMRKHINNI